MMNDKPFHPAHACRCNNPDHGPKGCPNTVRQADVDYEHPFDEVCMPCGWSHPEHAPEKKQPEQPSEDRIVA